MKSPRANTKRKRPQQTGTLVGVRLQPDMLAGIDQYATEHDITRPEAVRLIIRDWMAKHFVIKGE